MKILLSGLPATGKTTLGRALSTALGLPLATEAASELASAGSNVGPTMSPETLSAITLVQMARESQLGNEFVADRGPVDMLAYARLFQRHATDDVSDAASAMICSAIETISSDWLYRAQYDLIVYHAVLCGTRGLALQSRYPEYLRLLLVCFDTVINEQRLSIVRMPADLDVEDRLAFVMNALT